MSKQEFDRFDIITRLNAGDINGTEAANLLHLSVRHVKRLKQKVKQHGAVGIIHGNRGKPGHHRVPEKIKAKMAALLRKHYADFGPTLAAEKLAERHGIIRDPKTVRRIMMEEGLWKPQPERKQETHRTWRERRSAYGELEQFDGCYHRWFEERGGELCLLGAIDDATGKITKLQFATHEGVIPVMEFWKRYGEQHGLPRAIYLDKFSTYNMNHRTAKENPDTLTQFERACQELHIELIKANSPQAKGRIERLWDTLQDRLVKELRLAKVSAIEEANTFLQDTFIPKFNAQFGVESKSTIDLHKRSTEQDKKKFDAVFARHTERTVQNDFTFSFQHQWFQLTKRQPVIVCKKDTVTIEERTDGTIHVRLRGKYLTYEILPERPKKQQKSPWVLPATGVKESPNHAERPAQNHPWRRPFSVGVKKREFQEV